MKQGLSLRVSQHLALTPQLQQSIRLLQLSTLELSQEVEQMLDDNPFLELTDDAAPREEFGVEQLDTPVSQDVLESEFATNSIAGQADNYSATTSNDTDNSGDAASETTSEPKLEESWEGDGTIESAPDDGEWGGDALPRKNNNDSDNETDAADIAHSQESLQAHLHRQALGLRLSETDRAAVYFLIESLNDDGYLEDSLVELAQALAGQDVDDVEELEARLAMALQLLHHMEPAGVGARNLAECLSLQLLDCRDNEETRAAIAMCRQPMELLARRDVKRLAYLCNCTEAVVKGAIAVIGRLDPKPGRRFVNVERNIVVPDVIVIKAGRGFKVTLNRDVMPKLRVHDIYANALKQHKGQGGPALQQRLQEARWFIKNIQQRFDTILRVSSAIVERQKNFFTHGELAMRPLVLREIADELGLHESTISRVTTAKYMSTPFGTFELKYFFGSALGTETGGNASSTAVRALIKQFVASESLKKPLSDNQISEMLKEQGIECARRTVAKYREALRIAPANLRKTL
jgi:RNA polymerase sigma-54 factor